MTHSFKYFLLFFLLTAPCFAQTNETIEIATYYPAPYGAYNELTTEGNTSLATSAMGNVGIGTTAPLGKLHISEGLIYSGGVCDNSGCSNTYGFRNNIRVKNYSNGFSFDPDWPYSRIDVEKDGNGERVRIEGPQGVEVRSHRGSVEGTVNTVALQVKAGGIQADGDICANGGSDCLSAPQLKICYCAQCHTGYNVNNAWVCGEDGAEVGMGPNGYYCSHVRIKLIPRSNSCSW